MRVSLQTTLANSNDTPNFTELIKIWISKINLVQTYNFR